MIACENFRSLVVSDKAEMAGRVFPKGTSCGRSRCGKVPAPGHGTAVSLLCDGLNHDCLRKFRSLVAMRQRHDEGEDRQTEDKRITKVVWMSYEGWRDWL